MSEQPAPRVVFREAAAADLPEVIENTKRTHALHSQLYPDIFSPDPEEIELVDHLQKAVSANVSHRKLGQIDLVLFVAELKGQVIGHIFLWLFPEIIDKGNRRHRSLHIADISFHPDARNKGMGGKALAHVRDWAFSMGVTDLVATVWEGNQASQALFHSNGFTAPSRDFLLQIREPEVVEPPQQGFLSRHAQAITALIILVAAALYAFANR